MLKFFCLSLGLAASAAATGLDARACKYEEKGQSASIPTLSATELAALLDAPDSRAKLLDANGAATREKYGVIPGATLLSHYADYDVGRELGSAKDADLIFYCGGRSCGAAEKAARKAIDAGYSKVRVMKDGIKGWRKAGFKTQPFTTEPDS